MESFELFGRDEDKIDLGEMESKNEDDMSIFVIDLLEDMLIQLQSQLKQRMIEYTIVLVGYSWNEEIKKDAIILTEFKNS